MAAAFTHFHVEAAEMLFDVPEVCPFYGALTFDGVAVEQHAGQPDQLHLVVTVGTARAYLGPDTANVTRRALLLVAAITKNPAAAASPDAAAATLQWIGAAWESLAETVTELQGISPTSAGAIAERA